MFVCMDIKAQANVYMIHTNVCDYAGYAEVSCRKLTNHLFFMNFKSFLQSKWVIKNSVQQIFLYPNTFICYVYMWAGQYTIYKGAFVMYFIYKHVQRYTSDLCVRIWCFAVTSPLSLWVDNSVIVAMLPLLALTFYTYFLN